MVIAIDGPAGGGKTTIARGLAARLGFKHLDSGVMYRSLALSLLRNGGSPAERAKDLNLAIGDQILLDGEDVTDDIRTAEVSSFTSKVAQLAEVREPLALKQRELLSGGDWVAEGRDIGTVVAPNAELKIFLTASPEARARRRAADLGTDWHVVLRDQGLRDAQDRDREHSPLRPAPEAIELDTTDRPPEDVIAQIAGLVADLRKR